MQSPDSQFTWIAEVQAHMEQAFRSASVESFPSPYYYVESVFPQWFYDKLLASLPEDDFYVRSSKARTANPRAHLARGRFGLDRENLARLGRPDSGYLAGIAAIMSSASFLDAVMEPFAPYMELRPDLKGEGKEFVVRSELIRDRTGYGIGPHTDAPFKVVTLLFYLPRDMSLRPFGTSLYLPRQKDTTCWEGYFREYENFELLKTMEFKPNTVLGFMKTDHSFHGVEPIRRENIQRDMLHWVFMAQQMHVEDEYA